VKCKVVERRIDIEIKPQKLGNIEHGNCFETRILLADLPLKCIEVVVAEWAAQRYELGTMLRSRAYDLLCSIEDDPSLIHNLERAAALGLEWEIYRLASHCFENALHNRRLYIGIYTVQP